MFRGMIREKERQEEAQRRPQGSPDTIEIDAEDLDPNEIIRG